MTRILIAGATGLVGAHVLALALADDRVSQVVAPTRRALPAHAKLCNPVLDMLALPPDAAWWAVDGVVCTIGTTRAKAGSAAAFRRIDVDLQRTVAQFAHAHGAQRLALTSSSGADPHSRLLYMKAKGDLEVAVAQQGWHSLTVLRPGAIVGERLEHRSGERLMLAALSVVGAVLPKKWRGNAATSIAQALLEAAIGGAPGQHIVSAEQIG